MRTTITFCVTFFAFLFPPCLVHAQSPDPIWATYAGGNGFDFPGASAVDAAGSSSSVLSYSYRDLHPLQGNNYYRLRMVDKDGGWKLSRTHWLYFGDDARIHLQLVPNPASDQVTILLSLLPEER